MDVYFFKEDGLDDVCHLLLSLTQPHELNFETDLTDSYFHSRVDFN